MSEALILADTEVIVPSYARVNDVALRANAARYPEQVREPVMWLGGYFRERCSSSWDVIADRADKLGFRGRTSNYFYQILTGKYFREDKTTGKIAGSVDNLLQIIDAFRKDAQIAARAGRVPFVETSTWHDFRDYVDTKRAPAQVCKFGVIIGPTGSQKTHCAKHYCELNNHGACVHLEAPETSSMTTFVTDLAAKYGFSVWDGQDMKKRKIREAVNETRTIMVDNIQRLYVPRLGNNQPIFNYLQKLQDDTGCTVIMLVAALDARFLTHDLHKGFFEQFEGRAGGRGSFLHLPEYAPREDVLAIARAFDLKSPAAACPYLEKISREPGRVRLLFDALQTARQVADSRKVPLTLDLVKDLRGDLPKPALGEEVAP